MLNTDKNFKVILLHQRGGYHVRCQRITAPFLGKGVSATQSEEGGRGIRQYRKEDIETVKLIYHLVKEKGLTLPRCPSTVEG